MNYAQRKGRQGFDSYFGNYGRADNWRLAIGFVDNRPAVLVRDPSDPFGRPKNFVLIEWHDERVLRVRDFAHAQYVMADAEVRAVD